MFEAQLPAILAPVVIVIALVALGSAFGALLLLTPRLRAKGITGPDMHKPNRPEVPEMGGLGVVTGFVGGILTAVALQTFWPEVAISTVQLLAVLATVLIVTVIGILDDLLKMSQGVKALLPLLAAFPLIAIKAGHTTMIIPILGKIDFGIAYALVLVPLGVTGAANAVNMLAGFNGLEAGMGLVAMGSLAVIAYTVHAQTALVILLAGIGALLAALYFNWYPAKVFLGDVGTLSIGAILASAVVVGNFEMAGILVILPYFFDFILKALSGFPSTGWWGELRDDGKLYCPSSKPVGLCQWIMKLVGGIRERDLVLSLMGLEAVCGAIAIMLYVKF